MSISSEEVNYLIYRYLLESGFSHSAFTFGFESLVTQADISPEKIPPGALVTFIQKGLQYLELENSIGRDLETQPGLLALLQKGQEDPVDADDLASLALLKPDRIELPSHKITSLLGHTREVFACAWHPSGNYVATVSADTSARLWKVGSFFAAAAAANSNASAPAANNGASASSSVESVALVHEPRTTSKKERDVTCLDWNADGSYLATGAYDGRTRVFAEDGRLVTCLDDHERPVFALRWNGKGDLLLSGSDDHTSIVFDGNTSRVLQRFRVHSSAVLDVDWRATSTTFASCSTDKTVCVCRLGDQSAQHTFTGHQDEVNCVRWDPSGRFLASCSDDTTAKLWSLEDEGLMFDLTEHKREIYTLRFSPTGPGSRNPNRPLLLATSSFDNTAKLWDPEVGKCLHTLNKHTNAVDSVAFSPDGQFIATGSFDERVYIWSTKDATLLRSFAAHASIYDVSWHPDGDRLCIASDGTCYIADLRK